jgi:valyl-tRNA synthetase
VLDTWFSSALWPFATLGWPDDTPDLRAFYPTDLLVTARDIIYLWVARMIMMGLEFPRQIPFRDVYINPIIQAPDGRRMSKSLGTGIDPLDEIDVYGADALRFGLLAMSSSQDVPYAKDRVQQGLDLANKMWNASRLILLNIRSDGDSVVPGLTARSARRSRAIEDRWILSRLQRAVEEVGRQLDAYDFSHAALSLYRFFWSELCDWYLEIVKPRLYESEPDASATLTWVLEQVLALAHPMIPFVTEEIYSYLPGVGETEGRPEMLVVHPFPEQDPTLIDADAEAEVGEAIELTRSLRRWRERVGVAAGSVLPARVVDGDPPHELVARLARLSFDRDAAADGGEPLAQVGRLEILASEEIDAGEVRRRVGERRDALRSEIERAQHKLSNDGFVSKAPAEVVEAERRKLVTYRAELEELGDH